jgi:hypothetical protein
MLRLLIVIVLIALQCRVMQENDKRPDTKQPVDKLPLEVPDRKHYITVAGEAE